MKTLIIKNSDIKNSETFILDHAKYIAGETYLYHGVSPAEYGKKRSRFKDSLQLLNIKLEKEFRLKKNIAYNYYFNRLLSKIRPDIVLAEYGVTGAQIYQSCISKNKPLLIHFHGYDAHVRSVLEDYREEYSMMLKYCRAIVVVSRKMHNALVEIGADAEKVFVNPCGVDTSRFMFTNGEESGKFFLSVGRFVEKKAPQITLLAFSKVHKLHPDYRLVMIGDGPLHNACQDLSHALGIKDKVEFLGMQPHDVVKII
jgi:colanic acid/amylovoran biosynthesis glycosyltransferase